MRVLVLCTGNSARSQMAEGLLRAFFPGVNSFSAGSRPSDLVLPGAVAAMREIGVDIGAHFPKHASQFTGEPFDLVLTVCGNADQACPIFEGKVRRRVHMPFDDPAATGDLADFRRVRDEIRARLGSVVPLVRPARASDLDAVAELLHTQQLPDEGVAEQFGEAYAVAELDGRICGVAGVERYFSDKLKTGDGLLRSVATSDEARGLGLGAMLIADRIAWARTQGMGDLYLLTTTATEWFPRFGFQRIERTAASPEIQASREFTSLCPASSVLMRLGLWRGHRSGRRRRRRVNLLDDCGNGGVYRGSQHDLLRDADAVNLADFLNRQQLPVARRGHHQQRRIPAVDGELRGRRGRDHTDSTAQQNDAPCTEVPREELPPLKQPCPAVGELLLHRFPLFRSTYQDDGVNLQTDRPQSVLHDIALNFRSNTARKRLTGGSSRSR